MSVTEHAPTARNGDTPDGFQWQNLAHPDWAVPPEPPAIQGLLYKGKRHVISGPPESTKTLIAYLLLLCALREGYGVAVLDFEMGPHAAATLLRELGATDDELQRIHYTEPDQPPTAADIDHLVGVAQYVLIDAAAGAYDTTGLDDNARKDVEQFAAKWIRPLWQRGVATIVIDHVTKDTQTRGKFTIGSERKTGQADVHLSLDALKPLHRGGSGIVKVNVHKDRPGHLPRPTVYVVELVSDEAHQLTWQLKAPLEVADDGFRHTIYMERITQHMERLPEHKYSKNELETEVKGKAEFVRAALHELVADGYVALVDTHLQYPKYALVRPFVPGSSQVRPDEGFVPRPTSSPPTRGDEGGADELTQDEVRPGTRFDVHDPAVQAYFDDKADW